MVRIIKILNTILKAHEHCCVLASMYKLINNIGLMNHHCCQSKSICRFWCKPLTVAYNSAILFDVKTSFLKSVVIQPRISNRLQFACPTRNVGNEGDDYGFRSWHCHLGSIDLTPVPLGARYFRVWVIHIHTYP